jgi:hypothetical protein
MSQTTSAMAPAMTASTQSTRNGVSTSTPPNQIDGHSGHQRQPSHPSWAIGSIPITPITAMPTIAGSTVPRSSRSRWISPSASGSSSHAIA